MCHPRFEWIKTEEDQVPLLTEMQQYVAYNQQQWQMYHKLFVEVYGGNYGAYYHFLLEELEGGPYWSDIKTQLGQPQEEYDPEASVSGSRGPKPTDTSSSDSTSEDDLH